MQDIFKMEKLKNKFSKQKTNFSAPSLAPQGLGFSFTDNYSNDYQQLVEPKEPADAPMDASGNIVPGAKVYNIPGAIHGTRPSTDYLVIHRTEGHGFHPNDPRLTQKGIGAQITIDRQGNIHQIGDLNSKMWHAGPYNNKSLGIELTGRYLGNGKWEPLTDMQKKAYLNVGRWLKSRYGFTPDRIVNHAAIAAKSPNEGLYAKNLLINALYGNGI